MKHGLGAIERKNGDRFEGEFDQNKISGHGKFHRKNGD